MSIIDQLKAEVKNNPVFKDICHMFSLRQRTRGRLTVTRLKTAMEEEGFNYSRKQYEDVLRFMGKVGIGTLTFAKRGKVKSLDNIKVKLQSIGAAALGQGNVLSNRTVTNRYENLVAEQNVPDQETKTIPKKSKSDKSHVRSEEYPVYLTVVMGGKLVNIPAPANLTPENMGEFIVEFKKLSRKKDVEI